MKQAHKPPKLCFMASSGGHFEQIRMMRPLMEKYPSFVMTEKTAYRAEISGQKTYYLHQVNRMDRFLTCGSWGTPSEVCGFSGRKSRMW